MATPYHKTPRELALGSVPVEWREALLKRAADAGITHADDVAWVLVSAVVDAIAAAAAAGDAASMMSALFKTLPEAMEASASTAGSELRQQVLGAGEVIEGRLRGIAADTGKVINTVQERGVRQAVAVIREALIHEVRAFTDEVVVSRTVGAEALQLAGILLVAATATWVGLVVGSGRLGMASDRGLIRAILEVPIGLVIGPLAGWGTYQLLSDSHPAVQIGVTAFLTALALVITFKVF
ncbi:MAG: hypothetical protein WBX11_04165 [Thiobacillaceae bacterium]